MAGSYLGYGYGMVCRLRVISHDSFVLLSVVLRISHGVRPLRTVEICGFEFEAETDNR